jgi:putative flavoprotein involved in K+ transport
LLGWPAVYLSVSSHQRTPRRYRGKDCIWWNLALGDADTTVDQRVSAQPSRLMTGVGGGHDVDLRRLAADGVVLLGRALGGGDGRLTLAPDLGENLVRGDASLIALTRRCDEHVVLSRVQEQSKEECVQMPVKIARSAARPSFGLPELLVAIDTSR